MKMNRLLMFILALGAVPAQAQRAANHPDWNDGSIPVTNFSTLSNKPTGAAPADAYEPAEPASDSTLDETPWLDVFSGPSASPLNYVQGPTRERKARFTCEPTTALRKDFVLGHGIPSFGHMHQGTGNVAWNENSTYLTSRALPSSTCAGGPLNTTLYIEPAVIEQLSTGVRVAHRPQANSFYYVNGIQSMQGDPTEAMTWLRRDTQYILGANPSDYNDTARRATYAASGLMYPGSPHTPAGMAGIGCYLNSGAIVKVQRVASQRELYNGIRDPNYARHTVAEDGSDPWMDGSGNHLCTGTVAAPAFFIVSFTAPDCWDRHNLQTPNGRTHFWYSARNSSSTIVDACPTVTVNGVLQHYGYMPQLQVKTNYQHTGWNDYKNWYLESDRMHVATTECPDAANPCDGVSGGNVPATVNGVSYTRVSLDPCRAISTNFCPFSTFHADWGYGWKSSIIDLIQRECLGITVRGVAPVNGPAECDSSRISATRGLKYGGASPNASLSGGCVVMLACSDATPGNPELYDPVEMGQTGPFVIHGNH
jgi:hypothetical protein